MKKITYALAILFFILPSVSSAAALTQQQSTSLIAVVQSSPGTPASAFVSLITAFSNITVNQATSLITVVQAAPSVPATAFVDLLTSFTVDTPTVQPTTPTNVVPTVTSQPTNTTSNAPTPAPVITPPVASTPAPVSTPAPTPAPEPIITPTISREPYNATSSVFLDMASNIEIKSVSCVGQYCGMGGSSYKFTNKTNALGITFHTAVIKVWRAWGNVPTTDVSVELYSESGLVSKAGYWSTEGHLVAGEAPFVSNSTIGDTEATSLTVEVPVLLYLPSAEHTFRTEAHPNNQNLDNSNRYYAKLIELR